MSAPPRPWRHGAPRPQITGRRSPTIAGRPLLAGRELTVQTVGSVVESIRSNGRPDVDVCQQREARGGRVRRRSLLIALHGGLFRADTDDFAGESVRDSTPAMCRVPEAAPMRSPCRPPGRCRAGCAPSRAPTGQQVRAAAAGSMVVPVSRLPFLCAGPAGAGTPTAVGSSITWSRTRRAPPRDLDAHGADAGARRDATPRAVGGPGLPRPDLAPADVPATRRRGWRPSPCADRSPPRLPPASVDPWPGCAAVCGSGWRGAAQAGRSARWPSRPRPVPCQGPGKVV